MDMLRETLTAAGLENSPAARGCLPESNQREPQQYLDLVRRAVEAVDIPIIGSLNGTTEEAANGATRHQIKRCRTN